MSVILFLFIFSFFHSSATPSDSVLPSRDRVVTNVEATIAPMSRLPSNDAPDPNNSPEDALPESSSVVPEESTPAEPEDTPVEPEEGTPAESEETPAEPEDTPAEPEETPAEPEEGTPAEPEDTPVEPEEGTPAEPEETPAEPEEGTPAESEDTPAEPEDTPAEPEDAPAESEDAPAAPEDTPAEPEDTPAESEGTPAESEDEPEETPADPDDTPAEPEDTPVEPVVPETEPDTTSSSVQETTSAAQVDTTSEAPAETSSSTSSTASETTSSTTTTTSSTSSTTEEIQQYYGEVEDDGDDCPETCVDFVQGWKGDGDCDARCVKCPQFWEADGEFDGGDCIEVQNPETGEIEFQNADPEFNPDNFADEATDEPEWLECPSTCTNDMVGDQHCDKVECKYCHGENGDPNFYNANGVFDGNDCCDEICNEDWVGDGDCDDDSSYWDFSCMHCDFFYDKNGVFDAGDCCGSRCQTPEDEAVGGDFADSLAKPDDDICDEMCAQCPNFYSEDGVFDGGDCGADHPTPGTGLDSNNFDFDAETVDDWNNPIWNDDYGYSEDDDFETCPEMCNTSSKDWVNDGECDYNMCKNCESFWKDGVFDGGDCTEEIEDVLEKEEEIDSLQDGLFPNTGVVDSLSQPQEETAWDTQKIGGIAAGVGLLFCCCYCLYRRKARYDFDDNGYGHSYDKGWNEMASFTNWA